MIVQWAAALNPGKILIRDRIPKQWTQENGTLSEDGHREWLSALVRDDCGTLTARAGHRDIFVPSHTD